MGRGVMAKDGRVVRFHVVPAPAAARRSRVVGRVGCAALGLLVACGCWATCYLWLRLMVWAGSRLPVSGPAGWATVLLYMALVVVLVALALAGLVCAAAGFKAPTDQKEKHP
jgi:hypothetical protein